MKRQSSKAVAQRNEPIVERIREIKSEHPFWGYRKVCAYLRYVEKLEVNRKRILRLMREHSLLVKPNQRLRAIRTPVWITTKNICTRRWDIFRQRYSRGSINKATCSLLTTHGAVALGRRSVGE